MRRPTAVGEDRRARAPIWSSALALLASVVAAATPAIGADGVLGMLSEHVTPAAVADLEWAYGVADDRAQKLELSLVPEIEVRLPWSVTFTAIGRMRADAYDRLETGEPGQKELSDATRRAFTGDRVEFELREAYLEADFDWVYLNLGKQQIVWGQSDGLKVLDVVNPQSFREFILDDFDESRIPLWAANVEIPVRDFTVQVVWIPDRSYNDFIAPESRGVFEFTAPELRPPPPPAGIREDILNPDRPPNFFEDSDVGVRVKGFAFGWDVSFNYLYHYFDTPALYTHLELRPEGPTAVVSQEYERTHLVGSTFSNAFGDLTIRGELAFQSDRFFIAEIGPGKDGDGVVQTEELLYVLGLDWFGFTDTLISFQVFQSVLTSNPTGLRRDPVDTIFTLFAQHRFLADNLLVEGIWLTNVNHGDGLLRPKVTWAVTDAVRLWAGADIFYGSRNGLFGQFDSEDRVIMGIELAL